MKTFYEIRMGGVALGHAHTLEKAKKLAAILEESMIGKAEIVEVYTTDDGKAL